jgi:hypothetical protein
VAGVVLAFKGHRPSDMKAGAWHSATARLSVPKQISCQALRNLKKGLLTSIFRSLLGEIGLEKRRKCAVGRDFCVGVRESAMEGVRFFLIVVRLRLLRTT